jgi:superfamily II DNA helicase RecQ
MREQIHQHPERSSHSFFYTIQIFADLRLKTPNLKLLYVTPELMDMEYFQETLRRLDARQRLSMVVVDEVSSRLYSSLSPSSSSSLRDASLDCILSTLQLTFFVVYCVKKAHCISSWGHNFRPAFRKLAFFKTNFPNIPVAAFTATATPK